MTRDILRRCRFQPYRKGMGPTFYLETWDTGRRDHRGTTTIGYRLRMREFADPEIPGSTDRWIILFEGEDFNASPMYADDSDECVGSLMGFLTLKPGDTDRDYFDSYTPAQLDYCSRHAEALQLECMARFGEDC